MFYEKQPDNQKNNYKKMLKVAGSLSQMFSESECPYLSYRAHENIFCKYFEAENMKIYSVNILKRRTLHVWTVLPMQKKSVSVSV